MIADYSHVSEIAGQMGSHEQIQRMYSRYKWAEQYCLNMDVLELGCSTGQGLSLLGRRSRFIAGGDCSESMLKTAQRRYKARIPLIKLDAHHLPLKHGCLDLIIFFEAIYYLKNPVQFVQEALRVLRPGGKLIMCNPNPELPDFNPSPHSYYYYSARGFVDLLTPYGFSVQCFGNFPVDLKRAKHQILSFIKKKAVKYNLIPNTMTGKTVLKRIICGRLEKIPEELSDRDIETPYPIHISASYVDKINKVIFAVALKE